MRDAVRNTGRWKRRRAPTQDPSTIQPKQNRSSRVPSRTELPRPARCGVHRAHAATGPLAQLPGSPQLEQLPHDAHLQKVVEWDSRLR